MPEKTRSPHAILSIVPIFLVEDLSVERYLYIYTHVSMYMYIHMHIHLYVYVYTYTSFLKSSMVPPEPRLRVLEDLYIYAIK
jgi:hypothetical protein